MTSLIKANSEDLRSLFHGNELILLRDYVAEINYDEQAEACVSHYLHFWHLITAALEYNIPILKISMLFRLQDELLRDYCGTTLCVYLELDRSGCDCLTEALISHHKVKMHTHTRVAINSTAKEYADVKLELFSNSTCASELPKLQSFCEKNIKGCSKVNSIYGRFPWFPE